MMVSIVIPDTGLRTVVAMALAATLVKKNEKTNASMTPIRTTMGSRERLPNITPTASALTPRRSGS